VELFTAVAVAAFAWWGATGLLFYLNRLASRTYAMTMLVLSGVLGAGVAAVEVSLAETGVAAAYLGFGGALVLWGWIENSYLMGYITGPEHRPCPPELQGWGRFSRAVNLSLYHELLIIAVGVGLVLLSLEAANPVAAQVFGLLWIMRWSAKLNLFLGVANLSEDLLPPRQKHLASYMRRRPMNALFPLSVTLGTLLATLFGWQALSGDGVGEQVAGAMLATLAALAVLEHWCMVVPLPKQKVWQRLLHLQVPSSGPDQPTPSATA